VNDGDGMKQWNGTNITLQKLCMCLDYGLVYQLHAHIPVHLLPSTRPKHSNCASLRHERHAAVVSV
jgi:hypothetical protein